MIQYIYINIQSRKSYNTLKVEIVEKLNGPLRVAVFTRLDRT